MSEIVRRAGGSRHRGVGRLLPAFGVAAALGLATLALVIALAPSPGAGPARAAGPACNPARTHAAGSTTETIVSSAQTREYILHVPPSYGGSDAMPLVFHFHGLTMTDSLLVSYTGLNDKADAAGFIAVTPQGLPLPPFGSPGWNATLNPAAADDVTFVADMLDYLEGQLCIDPARVYSTGYSSGALMSVRLACSLPGRIAAIAPIDGAYFPPFLTSLTETCPGVRPVPVVAFHGTADVVIPINGGTSSLGFSGLRSIEGEVMPDWANHNGCSGSPQPSPAAPGVRLSAYGGCTNDATAEIYVVEDADGNGPGTDGGGHQWPGSAFDFASPSLGANTHEISANDLMWDFFVAHPLCTDGDGDIVCDTFDNCPTLPNVSQADGDADGLGNVCDNCPAWPNAAQNLPPWFVPPADDDCDGFSAAAEAAIGTQPLGACGVNTWPPDFDDSHEVDISDVLALKPGFGGTVPPVSPRYDIFPDGTIDISDVLALKPFFGAVCA